MMKKFIIFLIASILLLPIGVYAKEDETIDIHLFYLSTCTHCKAEKAYLKELLEKDSNINVYMYEVDTDKEASNLLDKVQYLIDGETSYLPYTVIGTEYRVGFNNSTKMEIENIIKAYRNGQYVDIVSRS